MTTFDWLLIISCGIAGFVALAILVEWWVKRRDVSRLIETGISSRTNEIEALKLKTKMRDKHVGLTDEVEITNIDSWCDPTKPRQWPRDPDPPKEQKSLVSLWRDQDVKKEAALQSMVDFAQEHNLYDDPPTVPLGNRESKPRKKRNPKKTYTPDE